MSEAGLPDRRVDVLLHNRLEQLHRASGLPILLAGTTTPGPEGRGLRITKLFGTLGRSPLGLEITAGRGLGGTVVSRAMPCRINDYATSTSITHDYDHVVVDQEKIRSIFAFPIVVDGTVRGVLYGATRDTQPIGDVALHQAGLAAASMAEDLDRLLVPAQPSGSDRVDRSGLARKRAERALQELGALTRTVADPALRDRLAMIHSDLGGSPWNGPAQQDRNGAPITLAPRELDALRLVEVGASNTAIAAELGLSVPTVKAYLSSAMRKLDVHNRTSAVHTARSYGLL
jgi:Response regulator containing a CheY-like receiver domain and an HTH DNA-binding domain